ncbi:MAG TPA: NUDIX hydrolase [Acidimicrobiales bacterium]|nr:NUDIX hydrolase [Acidimicrobiales bacterium]
MGEERVRAAGGVVWRRQEEGAGVTEVLLVHRPKYDDWSLPKGKNEPGESDEDCALREVHEETGLSCELGAHLGDIFYTDQKGRPKTARFWAMHPTGGAFTPNEEVDEVKWLPVPDALTAVTRRQDGDVIGLLAQHTQDPATILLVRHATAGERSEWVGDDRLRPLDDRGRRQAEALVDELCRFAVTRVLSSPYVRCVQSVEPLARARGLVVEETERLAEGRAEETLALIDELHGSTPVLCTHGDVVPVVLDALLPGQGHRTSKKGSTWALEVAGSGALAGRYLPPPA